MIRTVPLALAFLCLFPALAGAQAVGDGWWHTSGNQIFDAAGNPVRFSGVNWNGFESGNYVVHGLWGGLGRTWVSYLDQMDALGFNLIRLPFSGNVLDPGRMPLNIDYGTNPDLAGLTSLQVMDKIVQACGARGIRIILDYHRVEAGGTPEAGLWYTAAIPESKWIDNWKTLVTRYKDDPTVVGVDLFNEVHDGAGHPGPFWNADGMDEPYNWRTAARRCADAIQAINPNLLICVQGLHAYNGESGWWGAVHLGVKDHPLALAVANRLVYEVHDYGPNVWVQTWHNDPTFPANLPGHWDHQWGFLHNDGIAPVWVGEWGSTLDPAKELQWATSLRDYIQAKGLSWTWWCWTPNSGDTGGILTDDWTTTHASKLSLTSPAMYPGFSSPGGGPPPPPPPPGGGTPPAGDGGGGGNGRCGCTGLEALLLLFLRRPRRTSLLRRA